jgi:hypothetical protein
MHRLMSYGLLTVVCGVFTPGCGGDTSGERPTTNNPPVGNAGGGGSGGQTGGGNGGSAPTGMGGSGGGTTTTFPAACTGCVEIVVQVAPNPPNDYISAQFVIRPATVVDLSTAVLTWKVRALTPANVVPPEQMYVQAFANNNAAAMFTGVFPPQVALTPANGFTDADTWVNVTLDFNRVGPTAPAGENTTPPAADAGADGGGGGGTPPPAGGGFTVSQIDKTQIFQVGLVVGSTVAVPDGYVRVAIDELSVTGVDATVFAPRDFNMDAGGLTLNTFNVPPGTVAPVPRPAP